MGVQSLDMTRHPFITALSNGTCPPAAIRRYAVETYVLASTFPRRLASLVAICDDAAVRIELLRNILEEEGAVSFDGERLVRRADRQHGEICRRFAHAAGASDAELDRARREDRRTTWVDRAIGGGRLLAALAYLTIGFEGCVPPTAALIVETLQKNYGFSRDALEFFILHMTADAGHARTGAEMTAALVRSDADRKESFEGVKRATTAWWWWHRSFVH